MSWSWETDIYRQGQQLNRYPYEHVVSFVYRHAPPGPRSETHILEVGCGAGNNLWFAAREGFGVTGIDGSPTAIRNAQERFQADGLPGRFIVGDFAALSFPDEHFDLAIDRCAITCVGAEAAQKAVREVWRTLKPGGRFLCNVYSTQSAEGALTGAGLIRYYSQDDIIHQFQDGWQLLQLEHVQRRTGLEMAVGICEWRIIAEKASGPSRPFPD